ncbi:hypothetical protein TrVE_jg3770 [Triparma verrucosa]|uniref:Transmembrane protein n=1 Tax=Triparma verrucosa TaxID=1606542 RepID=A0A9W7FM75_9STRA|nr:hypothetical protein TrVE_jg3770 [Triparma verrucosa]
MINAASKSFLKVAASSSKIDVQKDPLPEELDAMLEELRNAFANTAKDMALKFTGVDSNILLSRSVKLGAEGDLFKAGLIAVTSELDRRIMEEQRKEDMKVERKETKRKALHGEELLTGIVGAAEKDRVEYRERLLDMDLHNFLDWSVSVLDSTTATIRHISSMLLIVSIYSCVAWINVYWTKEVIMQSKSPSHENVALFLLVSAAASTSVTYLSASIGVNLRQSKSYFMQVTIGPLSMAPVYAYYKLGGEGTNGFVLGMVFIAASSLMAAALGYFYATESYKADGRDQLNFASKRAKHLLEHGADLKPKTRHQKAKVALITVLPNLFIYGVLMLLAIGTFVLYNAHESTLWKVAVTVLALVVKIAGNKALIGLVGGLPMWIVDWDLYTYEFGTALILRILQLSIPDRHAAQLVCLFGAVAEVAVRVFWYVNFLKGGLKNKTMTIDQLKKYAVRGKLRVQDGCNDMVVEYMSSIIAGFFLIQLAPTGVFSFATETAVSSETVITLMLYQLVPELFLDFFVTFMEVFGGLGKLHRNYWSLKTGSNPNSKFRVFRIGDAIKAFFGKLYSTWCLTSFVLLVVMRSKS